MYRSSRRPHLIKKIGIQNSQTVRTLSVGRSIPTLLIVFPRQRGEVNLAPKDERHGGGDWDNAPSPLRVLHGVSILRSMYVCKLLDVGIRTRIVFGDESARRWNKDKNLAFDDEGLAKIRTWQLRTYVLGAKAVSKRRASPEIGVRFYQVRAPTVSFDKFTTTLGNMILSYIVSCLAPRSCSTRASRVTRTTRKLCRGWSL